MNDGEPRLPLRVLAFQFDDMFIQGRRHRRLSSSAWRAGSKGGCLALIICGVFQKGCEPSCISTTLPRWPTSAPGPLPRLRAVSGLSQAVRAVKAISRASIRFISHSLSGEDDDQAENQAADQHQRGGGRHVLLATLFAAPIKRER